ncbi:Methylaspartate ammonia-lyase, putative [Penicillium digitatum]|uniref:methylaspartate ammonia-lyase n=3 Tax=Penicillium digitatum TaxID=36651 RepID=K9F9L8_PEND2|nr:Methylaspartate ammonia-lyase, putative [Penicillium digitatum Pd1]EKV04757.1 Methylaspartate ammonia-lyase, putative [Penicillium digitatum PHI26]EKV16985.1 Methylaspartate ammonia-lyase, putative [Penicillium digitatum Pd1]QQK45791.1 Methylaspartate ammonia-lyase, putative [Penicillium digitatum]
MHLDKIQPTDVRFVCGLSGYFHKDLQAVKKSPNYDPLANDIAPVTPGFKQVVQAGEVISILLRLQSGAVAVGECVDVIFSGTASRDPLFIPKQHLPLLDMIVRPWLLECDVATFRSNAVKIDQPWPELGNKRLHTAVRYGLSQALLSATALANKCTITEIVAREWKTKISHRPVGILASCHRNDHLQLDRMIMKKVALLPHASFVHVNDIGPGGETMLDYVHSVSRRIQDRGDPGYRPRLHFDVYGTIGDAFTDAEIPKFLKKVEQAAHPYDVLIESPIVSSSKDSQILRLHRLKKILASRRINVGIVADEWCNTLDDIRDFVDADAVDYVQVKTPDLGSLHNSIDAVMYCFKEKVGCCLGGSANETDISARITAQVALATQPQFLLSKPGIGADEGLMILTNEMIRTLALVDNGW